MKAIIIAAPGDARMIEVEKPKPGPGDVLAKVAYSGICGTDLSILSGDMSYVKEGLIKYPVRIGHEWSGIVEEVGSGVTGFKPGDKVVSDSGVTCGLCSECLSGHMEQCRNGRSIGTVNCWDGSFAEYMLIPQRHMHKLSEDANLEEAALFEPATIALAGVKHIDFTQGGSVLVVGTGAIGLIAVALAKYRGAAKIFLSGRKQSKLNIGKELGADVVIDATKEDIKDAVMKYTGGNGINAIIETSGNIDVINMCLEVASQKAVIVLIGFYEKTVKDFYIDKIVTNQLQIAGILGEYGLVQEIIAIMGTGEINLKPLITHRFKYNDAIKAMMTANEKNEHKIKMMVEFAKM